MKSRFAKAAFFLLLSLFWGPSLLFSQNGDGQRYWVFFRDKGPTRLAKAALAQVREELGERTLKRRAKVLPSDGLVDESDLPVWQPYLDAVSELGAQVVIVSRWLNAASVVAKPDVLKRIRALPFVKKIQPVACRGRRLPLRDEPFPPAVTKRSELRYDYGLSYNQVAMLRVTELQAWGIHGGGVIVGMLDSGYDWQNHEALQHAEVLGEWDFVWNDAVTADEAGQDYPGQADHGTRTFSVIAGFMPGQLIGPAFGARYYLAKTERVYDIEGHEFEQPVEEDYWVAGLEWLERNGVDIVSTSLAYIDWYTPSDMDGNTAVVTVAADMAVKKGVFVAASAGNEGDKTWRIVTAPADGDSVVAVGAVRPDGLIATFSSQGPTADGRIKPDVVAQGVGVYTAAPRSTSSYSFARGTSFSCPLVAGVAALVLSVHPELTPMELRDALRETASRASNPDTLYGWGIVDAVRAALYFGPVFSNLPWVKVQEDRSIEVRTFAVSQHGFVPGSIQLLYRLSEQEEWQQLTMVPTDTLYQYAARLPALPTGTRLYLRFAAVDSQVGEVTYPRYFTNWFEYTVGAGEVVPPWKQVPDEFRFYRVFPNPFRRAARVAFDLVDQSRVKLEIFDVRGRHVGTLVDDRVLPAGRYAFDWRGLDRNFQPVSSGVYLVRLSVNGRTYIRKITYLR